MTLKNILTTVTGIIGSAVAALFGGWSTGLCTLLIFMGIDYITGILVAGVFKNSSKTNSGTLESRAGWKGLIRKGITLLIVLVAHRLDLLFDTTYMRDAAVIAFITNELISVIENVGLMGVPVPLPILNAIDVLKSKEGKNNA